MELAVSAIFGFTFSNQVLTPDIYGARCFRHLCLHFQQPSSHSRYIWSSLFPPSLASLSATKFSLQIYMELTVSAIFGFTFSRLSATKFSLQIYIYRAHWNWLSVKLWVSFFKYFLQILQSLPIQNSYCDHRNFDSVNQSYTRFPLHHFRRRRSISAMTYFFTYFFKKKFNLPLKKLFLPLWKLKIFNFQNGRNSFFGCKLKNFQ